MYFTKSKPKLQQNQYHQNYKKNQYQYQYHKTISKPIPQNREFWIWCMLRKKDDPGSWDLKRRSATGPPYVAGKKFFFPDFFILNKRSGLTIVKSKISSHLIEPLKNASKNKFKGSILTLKKWLKMGVLSILRFSQERLELLSSGMSHLIENSSGYNFVLFD